MTIRDMPLKHATENSYHGRRGDGLWVELRCAPAAVCQLNF